MSAHTMPETYKGPTPEVGDKDNAQSEMRESGTSQQQPLPNENLQNQPYSSTKTLDKSNQQHQWNDTDPDKGVSSGVTQGHTDPQKPKHGSHTEGGSSTGLPQGEDSRNPSSDHNPRTNAAYGGDAHGRDVTNQSHGGSTGQRNS